MKDVIFVDLTDLFLSSFLYQAFFIVLGILSLVYLIWFIKKRVLSVLSYLVLLFSLLGYIKVEGHIADVRIKRIISSINASGIDVDHLTLISIPDTDSIGNTVLSFRSERDNMIYKFRILNDLWKSKTLELRLID